MYSRALRLSCGLVAVVAIGAAAFLLVRSEQQISQQTLALGAFDQHARDTSAALVDARVGQQAYVAAGQGVAFWFGKTAASTQAAADGLPFYAISSVTNKGTKELVAAIAARLDELTEATRQAGVIELAQ